MSTLRIQSGLLVLAAVLGGCAAGPDVKQPDTMAPAASAAAPRAEVLKAQPVQGIPSEWGDLFQSPYVDALIKRAFTANPNAGAVQAALRRSQDYLIVRQGFFYPAVLAEASAAGSPGVDPSGKQGVSPDRYSIRTAQLSVGYAPDVLGEKRGNPELTQLQAGLQREAGYFTLASYVVAAAVQEASLRAQIGAQLNIVGLNRQSLEIVRNQFKLGYVSEEEVRQFELGAAHAQQALAPLQQQLDEMRDMLRLLSGKALEEEDMEKFTLETLQPGRALPSSLSSKLIEQRPDVRMAEARLYEVGAQYGVTVLNTLPRFTLAPGGMEASSKWMLKSGGQFFDLKADAAQAIFGAKALRAKPRAAQQALRQAGAQYRSVVMAALQEVADTLNVIALDERALKAATKAALAAGKTGDQTRKQYEDGATAFQALLVAQQNEQVASIDLVQAQTNRAGDSIVLFHALGGRWWKRDAADSGKIR